MPDLDRLFPDTPQRGSWNVFRRCKCRPRQCAADQWGGWALGVA